MATTPKTASTSARTFGGSSERRKSGKSKQLYWSTEAALCADFIDIATKDGTWIAYAVKLSKELGDRNDQVRGLQGYIRTQQGQPVRRQ